jgi:hypothetical protein
VSYGTIGSDVFNIAVPSGAHLVKVAAPAGTGAADRPSANGKSHKRHAGVTGLKAVARRLSFKLVAPRKLVGLPRESLSLLDTGTQHGALLVYGQYLGGVVVIEEPATPSSTQRLNLNNGSGEHARGIALPTVNINGATGQELDTALGTIARFTSRGVTYTVLGSVRPAVADAAARAL